MSSSVVNGSARYFSAGTAPRGKNVAHFEIRKVVERLTENGGGGQWIIRLREDMEPGRFAITKISGGRISEMEFG